MATGFLGLSIRVENEVLVPKDVLPTHPNHLIGAQAGILRDQEHIMERLRCYSQERQFEFRAERS
jgi:hypothetical protein